MSFLSDRIEKHLEKDEKFSKTEAKTTIMEPNFNREDLWTNRIARF